MRAAPVADRKHRRVGTSSVSKPSPSIRRRLG